MLVELVDLGEDVEEGALVREDDVRVREEGVVTLVLLPDHVELGKIVCEALGHPVAEEHVGELHRLQLLANGVQPLDLSVPTASKISTYSAVPGIAPPTRQRRRRRSGGRARCALRVGRVNR